MFHVTLTSGLHLAAAICLGSLLGCNQSPEVVGSDEPSEASVNSPDTPGDSPVTSSDSPDTSSDRQSGILVASTKPPEQPGHKHRNRLADQTSPYLLMHAHNPVDWYPWGEEALNKAKRENKLIFLSIGYSSCHWCHVMERESFMDEEIAAYLNEHFVCIKLDREERPDIDNIYMMAVQMMTGRGGWPLSAFLTPDAKPFFGGTYFPARDNDRPGHTGFLTIVKRVNEIWGSKRDEIEQSATRLTDAVSEELAGRPSQQPTALDERLVERVMATLSEQYDPDYGGFGYDPADPARPKFPEPSNLLFLVQRVRGQNDQAAREMLEGTLQRMAMGGIRDHLAGGFHRYSVDRYWRIPHFEKMLYDNGQLASVYAEAYQLTGRDNFRRVTVELLDFVQREMSTPEGAFYSALDADTEGEEGKFYRWTKDELDRLLSEQEKASFGSIYGLSREPNFEGHYFVPQLSIPLQESAETAGMSESELHDQLLPIRQKLLAERNMRVRPMTDTKVLTGWNGLMIRGLADAGRLLDEPSYNSMAARAAEMLLAKLRAPDGRLLRTYSEGEAKLNAYLDDYAFFVDGLIALHRSTGDRKWLALADDLTAKQIELFWDELNGGFFFTSFDHEELIARGKSLHDGVRPAGNSVAALNLLYLADALPKPDYIDLAEKTIQAASTLLERSPASAPRLTLAVAELIAAKSTGAATNP